MGSVQQGGVICFHTGVLGSPSHHLWVSKVQQGLNLIPGCVSAGVEERENKCSKLTTSSYVIPVKCDSSVCGRHRPSMKQARFYFAIS